MNKVEKKEKDYCTKCDNGNGDVSLQKASLRRTTKRKKTTNKNRFVTQTYYFRCKMVNQLNLARSMRY